MKTPPGTESNRSCVKQRPIDADGRVLLPIMVLKLNQTGAEDVWGNAGRRMTRNRHSVTVDERAP